MTDPHIAAVFVGQPKTINDAEGSWTSSIFRDPVTGPIEVAERGLVADKVTQPYHGGPDADICVHLAAHYDFWNQHYGLQLAAGMVGENFTLSGLSDDQVCAGDIVRVGTALFQVSGPRVPCANLARRIGRKDWVRLTIRENRTGFYMTVLETGRVQAGDGWQLERRFNPEGSITAINACLYLDFEADFAHKMTRMQGLADWWKEQAVEKKQQQSHWTAEMKDA